MTDLTNRGEIDDTFIRSDTTHECDGQTDTVMDRRTNGRNGYIIIPRLHALPSAPGDKKLSALKENAVAESRDNMTGK